MKVLLEHKNICLILGVLFGLLSATSWQFLVTSSIFLIIFAIYSFEIVSNDKKELKVELDNKLLENDKFLKEYKKEIDKMKGELETLKNRLNFNSMFGK